MKVLLAFDKFKGSLTAAEACDRAAEAILQLLPDCEVEKLPLTDGGEGFAELLTRAGGGKLHRRTVTGPRGRPVEAAFGLVPVDRLPATIPDLLAIARTGEIAVVEMAEASGMQRLAPDERDPWRTTSRGTGELLLFASSARPTAILLGVGGSATHDLGLGALQVLGLKIEAEPNQAGEPTFDPIPANWKKIKRFTGETTPSLPPLRVASDVQNPLLGPRGAATVFAPQKGLRTDEIDRLEQATERVAHLLCDAFGRNHDVLTEPGSGAAGGIAAGLRIACGATVVAGFTLVATWLDLDRKLREADLVLTGEGTFDESSLEGKGPGAILRKAVANGKTCLLFGGRITVDPTNQAEFPDCRFREITPRDHPVDRAMKEAGTLLAKAVLEEVTRLSDGTKSEKKLSDPSS